MWMGKAIMYSFVKAYSTAWKEISYYTKCDESSAFKVLDLNFTTVAFYGR